MPRPKRPSWPCHFLIGAVSGCWEVASQWGLEKKFKRSYGLQDGKDSMEIRPSSFCCVKNSRVTGTFDSRNRTKTEISAPETWKCLPTSFEHRPKKKQHMFLKIPWFSKVRGTSFPVHPFIIYKGWRAYSVSRYCHPKSPRWHPMLARYCAAIPALSTTSGHW